MHKTTPSEDLAWLAGIIDGEGSIANYQSLRRSGAPLYNFAIVIVNTDIMLLDKIERIYRELNLHVSRFQKSATRKQRPGSYSFTKPCYEIHIRRVDDLKKFIPLLLPHLAGEKLTKAQLLLETLTTHKSRVTTKREAPVRDEAIV